MHLIRIITFYNIQKLSSVLEAKKFKWILPFISCIPRFIFKIVNIDSHNTFKIPSSFNFISNLLTRRCFFSYQDNNTRAIPHCIINPIFNTIFTFSFYLSPFIWSNKNITFNNPYIANLLDSPRISSIMKTVKNCRLGLLICLLLVYRCFNTFDCFRKKRNRSKFFYLLPSISIINTH